MLRNSVTIENERIQSERNDSSFCHRSLSLFSLPEVPHVCNFKSRMNMTSWNLSFPTCFWDTKTPRNIQGHDVGRGWCWKKRNTKWICSLLWVLLKFHRNSSSISGWPIPFVNMPWKLQSNSDSFRHLGRWCTIAWITSDWERVGTWDHTPVAWLPKDFPFWSFNRCH